MKTLFRPKRRAAQGPKLIIHLSCMRCHRKRTTKAYTSPKVARNMEYIIKCGKCGCDTAHRFMSVEPAPVARAA